MAGKNSTFVNNSAPSVDDTYLNLYKTENNNIILGSGQSLSDAIDNQMAIGVSRYAANNFYIDSGVADAYVLTLAASMTNPVSATVGYFIGMTIRFRAGNANTGASTVNANSAGVKNLKQTDGTTDLAAGDIPTTQDSIFRYNGTVFVLQTGQASSTAKGIIEIATYSEVIAGTDSQRAIVPSSLLAAFANLKATNGYTYLPNGLIMQWGEEASFHDVTTYTATITFPIAFPNAVLQAVVGYKGASSADENNDVTATYANLSTTGFTLNMGQVTPAVNSVKGVYWAIGW